MSPGLLSFHRYAKQNAGLIDDNLSIAKLAQKYGIPKSTLRKRIVLEVKGTGHASGGKGKSKVFKYVMTESK